MQKTIFFDLDDTLTPQSTWLELNMKLDITAEEDQALFDRYLKDELAYKDWTKELVAIHKSHGSITLPEIIELAENINLRPDAVATVLALREKGYRVILLSGSVDTIVGTIAMGLGIEDWFACSTLVFDDNNVLIDIESIGDEADAKLKLAHDYIDAKNIDLEDCYAVGDGGNDIELFKVMKGIAFGDHKVLNEVAWKQVQNLSEVVALID
jgi:phosphoserine phosphatase